MQILGILGHLEMPDWAFAHELAPVDAHRQEKTRVDTVPDMAHDTVPPEMTVPFEMYEAAPNAIPVVTPDAITAAVPDTVPAMMPDAVPDTVPVTVPDTVHDLELDMVPDDLVATDTGADTLIAVHWRDLLLSADWLHYYLEASKLAYADRNRYIADPRYVEAPGGDWERMLDPGYLAYRAALIGSDAMDEAAPGDPGGDYSRYGTAPAQPDSGTSHISIIDRDGNAVSMTTTIEQVFGSRIMADGGTGLTGGFHLNNELTDFSLSPVDDDGRPIANRVQPGKRPRSSMAPSLIFHTETGELLAAVGSPGGAGIIHFVAKTILGMYDFGLNAQEAIDLPNFANYNGPSVLEEHRFPPQVIEALEERGHVVLQRQLTSGLQAIQRTGYGFFGGADPRREGVVMGD